ncbi:hypothetical protein HanPSC8_Chr04g0159031 [Helianthus annuus]|nr:hypothetical protein HanPSC8_Chr04g0159031 [Helianthus annuus]
MSMDSIATGSISSLLCVYTETIGYAMGSSRPKFNWKIQTSWSGDVGVDETGVEPNEIDLVMTQNGCQDQML